MEKLLKEKKCKVRVVVHFGEWESGAGDNMVRNWAAIFVIALKNNLTLNLCIYRTLTTIKLN